MPARRLRALRLAGSGLGLAAALVACVPREADAPVSERARATPPPVLVPTETFAAPRAEGAAAVGRLGAETEALAGRAEALRARGAALSGAGVVDPAARARLEAARQADGQAPEPIPEPDP